LDFFHFFGHVGYVLFCVYEPLESLWFLFFARVHPASFFRSLRGFRFFRLFAFLFLTPPLEPLFFEASHFASIDVFPFLSMSRFSSPPFPLPPNSFFFFFGVPLLWPGRKGVFFLLSTPGGQWFIWSFLRSQHLLFSFSSSLFFICSGGADFPGSVPNPTSPIGFWFFQPSVPNVR